MSSNDNHPAGAQDADDDLDIAIHDLDDVNVTQVRGTPGETKRLWSEPHHHHYHRLLEGSWVT